MNGLLLIIFYLLPNIKFGQISYIIVNCCTFNKERLNMVIEGGASPLI